MIKIYKNGQWNTVAGYKGAILEVASFSNLPAVGSANTLYITEDDNSLYRWTGSTYVAISSGSAVGTITDVTVNGTSVVTNNVAEIDLTGLIPTSAKGAAGGVAELDNSGQVPAAQLPSYVDDVIDLVKDVSGEFWYKDAVTGTQSTPLVLGDLVYNSASASYMPSGGSSSPYYHTFLRKIAEPEAAWADDPATYRDNYLACMEIVAPETGKIYVGKSDFKTYRWSGSNLVEISKSLALGETSSTAYAGNKGKANADAIAAIKDGTSIDSFGDVETAISDVIHNPMTTAGDIIYGGANGAPLRLPKGTNGQILKMGWSGAPIWDTAPRACPSEYGYIGGWDVGGSEYSFIRLAASGCFKAYTYGFLQARAGYVPGTDMSNKPISSVNDISFLWYIKPKGQDDRVVISMPSGFADNGLLGIEVNMINGVGVARVYGCKWNSTNSRYEIQTGSVSLSCPSGKYVGIGLYASSSNMRSWVIEQNIEF